MIIKFLKKYFISAEYITPHLGRWNRKSCQILNNIAANYDHCGDDKCNIQNMKKTKKLYKLKMTEKRP